MANLPAALRSPAAQNLIAAAAAGAAVLARPARFPKWARRGMSLANTAGTAGSLFLGQRDGHDAKSALGVTPVHGPQSAGQLGSALAAASGGIMFVTSRMGLKIDGKIEQWLLNKGVKHPRIWMAVGVVGAVYAIKTVQDVAAAKVTDKAQQVAARQPAANSASAKGDELPVSVEGVDITRGAITREQDHQDLPVSVEGIEVTKDQVPPQA